MFSILLLALCLKATAQLLGCHEIDTCPHTPNTPGTNCRLKNQTVSAIGVSRLNTSLSTNPLSWTVTEFATASQGSMAIFKKDYYLGQPASLRLSELVATKGCAIFFEGISQALDFQFERRAIGTCEDALTAQCVQDLTAQAKDYVVKAAASLDCNELASSLQSQPPPTCPYWYQSWGLVTARTITGPDSPAPLKLENCNPTLGKNNTVSHIESFNASINYNAAVGQLNFALGVTPIMTVFASTSSNGTTQAKEPVLANPEVHLNCLRVKPAINGSSSGPSSAGPKSIDSTLINPLAGLSLALLAWFLSIA